MMVKAIWISIFIHALILTIHFEPEIKKFKNNLSSIEVMLVNTKTAAKPDKADVLAQANLDRGGNTEQNHKIKSALPAVQQQETDFVVNPEMKVKSGKKEAKTTAEETKKQKNVAELEKKAKELMTQLQSKQKVDSNPVEKTTTKEIDTGDQEAPNKKIDINHLTAAALEMDKLEALIAKQQDEYQKRPKRKFIGARAQKYRDDLYVEAWRQKIERIGNLNYPEAAKSLKMYGQLQMTVSIKADGSLESIEINRSSGYKVLDEAAKHIVELAAPYAKFSEEMHKEVDILSITRTWMFTKEDSLATGE